MSAFEIESILKSLLPIEPVPFDPPSDDDWTRLQRVFGCRFGDDFVAFISLMSKYRFPGDILNVSTGRTNGNDSIELSYNIEIAMGAWDAAMIPFYAIGNGDYFCINKSECPNSRVFYYYHERQNYEIYSESFEEWVSRLPGFLSE